MNGAKLLPDVIAGIPFINGIKSSQDTPQDVAA